VLRGRLSSEDFELCEWGSPLRSPPLCDESHEVSRFNSDRVADAHMDKLSSVTQCVHRSRAHAETLRHLTDGEQMVGPPTEGSKAWGQGGDKRRVNRTVWL